ncbi:hypothetical protein D3C85_1422010 [compost metagenome]
MSATSFVGARIMNSADCLQFWINTVSMMAAAKVDFEFFLAMSRKNSLIICTPSSGLYAPKIAPARSSVHGSHASPMVGLPGASTIRSRCKTCSAAAAESGNNGSNGIRLSPLMIRSSQSWQAVVQVGII